VGVPVTRKVSEIEKDGVCVMEVSSFQLESSKNICPHVSCVLNIAPDHLERHYTMENYVYLKKRILKNQTESEFAVLNYDDPVVRTFALETKANVVWISLNSVVKGGYRKEGKLYYFDQCIMDQEELKLKGDHNVYNALFAITVAKIMGVCDDKIITALKDFKGVKHRTQLICSKYNVNYVNDSKATNTASTISAINSLDSPTILIIGGSEKGEDYSALFQKIKTGNVKHVIITGASRFNMLNSAVKEGVNNLTLTDKMENAVIIAKSYATDGDTVLLSPACASFDEFSGYEERGDKFIQLVEELD